MPLAAAAAIALACRLADPAIAESSGAAAAPASTSAWFVTHNDSGDRARFWAVDRSCRTAGAWEVRNATAVDWEDVAAGPGSTLWFGDIGDNRARRESVSLYRVDGAALPAGGGVVDAERVDLRYEDGAHDAETLLVHPVDGRTWVVTKTDGGDAVVYEAGADRVLRRVAELALDVGGVTGGDVSPDGRRVVLRTYLAAYEWDVVRDDVAASVVRPPVASTSLAVGEQGEAIAYVDDGRTLLTTAEGARSAVRTFPSGDVAPTPATTAAPPAAAGETDGDDGPAWVALAGVTAAVVVAVGALVVRTRRRGE